MKSLSKPIVLVGLMGSGKTSVGRRLSKIMERKLIDTDDMVEECAGISISEIFNRHGEEEFRRLERDAIVQATQKHDVIISTGGGAIEGESNRRLLWANGIVFYLKASIPCLLDRLKTDNKRPLLKQDEPEKVLARLLEKREPFYDQAHHIIEVAGRSPDGNAAEIMRLYAQRIETEAS